MFYLPSCKIWLRNREIQKLQVLSLEGLVEFPFFLVNEATNWNSFQFCLLIINVFSYQNVPSPILILLKKGRIAHGMLLKCMLFFSDASNLNLLIATVNYQPSKFWLIWFLVSWLTNRRCLLLWFWCPHKQLLDIPRTTTWWYFHQF